MLFFLTKSPTYRNTVSYTAVVAALAGTVASVFPILNVYGIFRSLPAFPIFYGIYSAFTYVPAIIAFHTLEKKTKISEAGKYSIFLGFVWAAVCILAGLAVTIMAAIYDAQGSVDLAWIERFANGMSFLLLMGWGFIAVNLLLLMAYLRHLNGGSARISFVTYTILNIISAVAFTVLAFSPLVTDYTFFDVYGYLNVFLVDFPTVVAVFIVFYMGHLWMDNDENAVVNEA
ncbi:hypothetical protein [Parasitella parasitica]|uniref:Uncharacterized protein n=1 Tax=Parasitella parasitica TaxID=35722 RepID=A0A0B7MZZ0_9FUNG|nr:hypothetical protein [Parasitella parasitica]